MTETSPTPPQNAAFSAPAPDSVVLDLGLKAQGRMLPYALGFFGIGLPLFLWTGRLSLSLWLLAFYMLLFIGGWTAFMVLRAQVERRARDEATDANIQSRLWRQSVGGGLWSLILFVISLTAGAAGQHAEIFLMICAGAAAGIILFSSPVLLNLLVLGPIAAAGPIIAFHTLDQTSMVGNFMTGGLALALAIGVVLNRHMREHYVLQYRQQDMMREREAARAASDAQNEARMALMETLSREVQTGLKGVEQNLLQGLSLLARAPSPRQYVDAALSEVGHLQSILVTTLDNDTAAAGRIEIEVRPLDIELICEKMMAQFADLARGKDLTFTLTAQGVPHTGAAMGDEHRVEQVLAHLLSNALLYTQQGRVELKLLPADDGALRVEVVDSGPGLSRDELEQAFTPHVRIARTSSGHSGAGLGLSLSRSLAELMGGRIGAESTLDVGSKFWLDLPFDVAAVPPPRPQAEDTETTEASERSTLRVLLLSDDSLRAAQLRDTLEHLGHKCLTSTSRERALSLARKAPVDACLISTGAFENLDDPASRQKLDTFLTSLRNTQEEARLNILALLPAGDQAEDLQDMGVKPLLLPQTRESLGRALVQA